MKRVVAIFVSIVTILGLFLLIVFSYVKLEYKTDYREIVNKYAYEYGLKQSLVFAIIKAESSFNKDAVSNMGAVGLMQIMPKTYDFVCSKLGISAEKDALFDPDTNIRVGCFYLNYLSKKFSGDEVIAAYNLGETRLNKLKETNFYDINNLQVDETRNYLKNVKKNIRVYEKILG